MADELHTRIVQSLQGRLGQDEVLAASGLAIREPSIAEIALLCLMGIAIMAPIVFVGHKSTAAYVVATVLVIPLIVWRVPRIEPAPIAWTPQLSRLSFETGGGSWSESDAPLV